MASSDNGVLVAHTVPGRNPRRRQRNDSTEALSLHSQPKRKRNKVSQEIFNDPSPLSQSSNANDMALEADVPVYSIEIPTRAKPLKRSNRLDDLFTLARTPNYSAKLLPSLPEHLRTTPFRGYLPHATRLVLALTHTTAYTWDRTSTAPSPVTRKFELPSGFKPTGPLPFGGLVTSGSSQEHGLVVVSATTGKISYWENVENADALSLFEKRRNGLEGGVSGMFSGETITKMENADHAGFILIFSSGRSALLSLRDAQSRPTVTVQFLKGEPRNARSGLFGGLKSALTGGGWLRSVVAAKSRISSTRGQMDLLLANEDARFQFWTLGWSGHTDFHGEIDVHQQLKEEIILELGSQVESALTVKLVDFALIRDLSSAAVRAAEGGFRIIALCEVAGSGSLQFVLADITLTVESVKISRILQLRSFAAPMVTEKHDKPKILTSESCQTALIAFEKALVMISLATFTNTPNLQIAAERDVVPEPFEETLYLRDDENIYFTGADSEGAAEPSGQAVVNLFVNARGIIRVVLPEPEDEHHAVQRHRISAKSRIEQAVYYGTKTNNPFNLAKSSKLQFDSAEVEEAALAISKDIITSAGQSSGDIDIDVASHLAERASRLKSLALHLKHGYAPLSRKVRWLLSFDAEKIAAAQEIWRLYQVQQQDGIPEGKLLTELINMIDDRYNSPLDPSKGETDEVRHWFIKHVNHMDQLIMWAYQSFYELVSVEYEEPTPEVMAPLVHQADEMVLGSLSAAFQHRAANAWDYNLENEVMRDGLLQEGYEDLPEFWTSRFGLMSKIQELVDNSRDLVILCSHLEGEGQLLIERIAQDNPKLIDTVCRCWEERCRWQTAVDDSNTRAVAASLVQMYHTKRTDMIAKLHEIGMLDEAVHLGEKYKDMDSLVLLFRLTVLDAQKLQSPSEPPSSHEKGRVLIAKVAALERRWYAKFGKEWADTLYANLLLEEQYGHLLNQAGSKRKELTDFLREDASRKKFSWIHDILGERDYLHAAETLLDIADAGAQSTWSQRIDLSLSKLSLLATAEAAAEAGTKQPNESALLAKCNKELSVAQVRQRIYDLLHATTFQALDEQAEVTLVMEAYGNSREGSALGELLKQAVEALMQGPGPDVEQLLDLLTLLDRKPAGKSDSPNLSDEVFVLALEALAGCDLAPDSDRFQLLSASTWRRIFIQDDWHAINNTERQSDAQIAERLAATCLFQVFYIGIKKSWWPGALGPDAPTPSDVLGIGSTADGLLAARFPDDTIRRHVAKEVAQEDTQLQAHIEHDRLEHWVQVARKQAAAQVDGEQREQLELEDSIRQAGLREREASRLSKGRGIAPDVLGEVE